MTYRTQWLGCLGSISGAWRLRADSRFVLPAGDNWQPFTRGPHSELYRIGTSPPILAKVIRPRSQPRDMLRKYVNAQAKREWRSIFALRQAGLATPAAYGWAVSISPFARYESTLFMQEIEGFQTSLRFIRESEDESVRRRFFERLAADMARLHGHGLIHKDGHFGNIGWGEASSLVWIDNDIRRATTPNTLATGFRHMQRMLRRTARTDVHDVEWRHFDACLRAELERWPTARLLIDEVQ